MCLSNVKFALAGACLPFLLGAVDIRVTCPKPASWKLETARIASGDIDEFEIRLASPQAAIPPRFDVSFDVPQLDAHHKWTSSQADRVKLPADWACAGTSRLCRSMPLVAFLNDDDRNRICVSVSEAMRTVAFEAGLREEDCRLVWKVTFFSEAEAPCSAYSVRLRIDRRDVFFGDAIRAGTDWIVRTAGLKPIAPPAAAFEPLYSSWYSFHQDVFDKDIEAECAEAAKLGMKVVIVDDGWQTDDTNRGYAYTGDWEVSKRRFPDMAAHVKRVHDLGMKYMLWYGVPMMGVKAKNYERFRGKYLWTQTDRWSGYSCLDPRFPEVRAFLCDLYEKALRDWDLDGLKLDFIDAIGFHGEDPAVRENYAGRDIKTLPEAVDRLMKDVFARLKAVKPEVLVEFRQDYTGPAIRQYGNMMRSADCPGDLLVNRLHIANLRLTSGETAVHADMLAWNRDERVEVAARHVLAAMFGVIQYSVMLRTYPEAHKRMIAHWLRFSQEHRDALLRGAFRPHHFEALYPWMEAWNEEERLVGVYVAGTVVPVDARAKRTFVLNGTGGGEVIVDSASAARAVLYDTFGTRTGEMELREGLNRLALPVSGYAEIRGGGLSDPQVKAVWPAGLDKEMNTLIAFRAPFEAAAGEEVWLDMAAWYSYRVTLNGDFVAFGPARGPKGLFRPDRLRLPVKAGRNEVQVEVAGYNCRSTYLMRQPPFFKGVVSVNGKPRAVSGRDFKAYRVPRVQKTPRYSYERTFSEAYVLPGRDRDALALAPAPEPKLIDRVAALPDFTRHDALVPVAVSHVFEDMDFKVQDDRALAFPGVDPQFDGFTKDALTINTSYLAQRLAYRDGRPTTAAEKVQTSFALKAGDSLRFDVGLNDTGFPGTTVTVHKPGRLVFTFDETLLRGEVHGCERYHYNCANIIVWDFTEPGTYRIEAFEPYVLRWLEVGVLAGEMTVARPYFRAYKDATAARATFRASDPALVKIFEAAKETMRQNAVDVFMDCPSRERAGWNCDAFFTAPAATLLTGSTALERVFEENHALAETFECIPEGMFPMAYPADHPQDSYIPNWAMWFVLQSEEYLRRSGDRQTIEKLRPRFEKLVTFLWKYRNSDGLLEKLPSWVFIEWSKANAFVQDVNYPSNMTWAMMLEAVDRLYGRPDLAAEAARVRAKIRAQSWNGRYFRDHAVRGADGELVVQEKDITETCQYYAFFSGVGTKELHPGLWQSLLTEFGPRRDDRKVHPEVYRAAAFIGNYLRLKILDRENRGDLILADCKGYFTKMAEETGTLWEHDDTQASCCHGFASHAAVLLARGVLGIERIDLVAKKLVVRKDVRAKLDWVEGDFPAGTGRIRVRREGGVVRTAEAPDGWTVEMR